MKLFATCIALAFALAACTAGPAAPTGAPSPSPSETLPSVTPAGSLAPSESAPLPTPFAPTAPVEPLPPTPATSPAGTDLPALTPQAPSLPEIQADFYLDDRSTPAALLLSFYNAINRREYLRAYSYYTTNTAPASLEEFTAGYEQIESVRVRFGSIYSEGAAGSIYTSVSLVLDISTPAGTTQKKSGCYVLRMAQPGNFGAPPIAPLHIERGTVQLADPTAAEADLLASACSGPDYPTGPGTTPAALEDVSDLGQANYIDNRSGPVEVVSSVLNAINKNELVRAYSYWKEPAQEFEAFVASYADVKEMTALFGRPVDDPGAGQIYYSLPAVLTYKMNGGFTLVHAACYTLHLSQPGFQATPPFVPLGIRSVITRLVDPGEDPQALLASACP